MGSLNLNATPLEALEPLAASNIKKAGWPSVVRTVVRERVVLVTNHDEPEVVMMAPDEYSRVVEILNQAQAKADADLEALRKRFDERLAALKSPDSSDRLRAAVRSDVRLKGQVKSGSTC
ncbi:MAG: type II toxin-antitoxin system Phd/YefM family antitoxin [Candidatus Sericytochromatia bacterium]|nr:type II toxin-antitoxin system Phd/YefM family antitoxin [Candidatus Tanganyikabacteria bacterium]